MGMTEITPGTELDKAVAKAVGCPLDQHYGLYHCKNCHRYKIDRYTMRDRCFCDCDMPRGGPVPTLEYVESGFHPSVDLNAAFAAAEKVRLFDIWALARSGRWRITPAREGLWFVDPVLAMDSTPALAICAAILKLKEES
jgi:hypothetical protein